MQGTRLGTRNAKIKIILAFEKLRAQEFNDKIIAVLCGRDCFVFIVVCSVCFGNRDQE